MNDLLKPIYVKVPYNLCNELKINSKEGIVYGILKMNSKSMSIDFSQQGGTLNLSYAEFEFSSIENTNCLICNVRLNL